MDALLEVLDGKLKRWDPETSELFRQQLIELIELTDQGLLDLVRSRRVEQDVLDILDESEAR